MVRFIVTILLLVPTITFGATNARRDSIRVAAFNQLGIPTTGTSMITTAKANEIINYAVQEVSSDFPAVEKLDTVAILPTPEGGALPSDFSSIRWCQVMASDSVRVPLEYISPDTLYKARGGSQGVVDKKNIPLSSRYYYTHAGRLLVYPKFRAGDIGDTLYALIAYYAIDDTLSTDSSTTGISEEYRSALLDWICYRLEYLRFRYEAGNQYLAKYEKARAEATGGK
jgi:hypothetical protein